MKIVEIKALHGSNFWSKRPVIRMVVDLEELKDARTNQYPSFLDRLVQVIPSLAEHKCSLGVEGGFLQKMREGTDFAHVIEHLTLELQYLAYIDAYFCRSFPTKDPGIYLVVFEYLVDEAGIHAAEQSVRIIQDILAGKSDEEIDVDGVIDTIDGIQEEHYLGPTTMSIIEEAKRQNITVIRLDDYNLVQLGEGKYQKRIQASLTSHSNVLSVELAGDKKTTKMILEDSGIPVPKGTVASKWKSVLEDAEWLGYPVVVKPYDGHHGKGVTIGVKNVQELQAAFDRAKEGSERVIVERMAVGKDFRILVVDGKFTAAANRVPAHVIGDGQNTIQALISKENRNPRRGRGHQNIMTLLHVSDASQELLAEKGYTLESVPPAGEFVQLERTANLSTGGSAIDLTDKVHSANKFMFERVARIVGLDIAGIDVIAPSLEVPITTNGGAIIEVNAAPGLRMHISPSEGKPRNVTRPIVQMLFPQGTKSDILIVSVTGTNGKTTTTRLVAHVLKGVGHGVGMTSTDGIYIRDRLILEGDMSGPRSARLILQDPTIDCAVFETARGGLLRDGLGYGTADVGCCLNVSEDHMGLGYIETLDDLARLKGIVPSTVRPGGHSVLNADDRLCREMAKDCTENLIWFSMNPQNPTVQEHVENGGTAVVYQNGYITVLEGDMTIPVARVYEIPITLEGKAAFNIQNALAATAICHALKVKVEDIRVGLSSFFPSPTQTPGRMNFIPVRNFDVVIDYAHNPRAYLHFFDFVSRLDYPRKVLVLDAVGDRRDQDIEQLAAISGKHSHHVVIYEDKDLRGRQPGEIADVLKRGFLASGYPAAQLEVAPDEWTAIGRGLELCAKGDLLVYMTGRVRQAIKYLYEYKEKLDPIGAQVDPALFE